MPRLISNHGARDVFVADEDTARWQGMVQSGDFRIADGETASIVDPYGHQTVVDHDVLAKDADRGVANTYETQDQVVQRGREKRLESKTSAAGAFTRNLFSAGSFGLTDALVDDETLEADQLHHGTASALGTAFGIGGTLLLGNDFGLAKLFGGGAEVAGVTRGARELALAEDALTAERVGSTLSSNAVLAGERASSAGERALARSGRVLDEATIARQGLTEVPADLIGLDAAGLKQAAAEERAAMRAGADAEKVALEEARKPMRAAIADEVKELHLALETEAPIYKVVKGADVQKIEGMKTASAQLAKSYSGLRSTLDNPLRVIENTDLLKGHLQMRQAALEMIQGKSNELRAVLGNDARALGLEYVDDALDMTRSQIARIGEISKATPVASEKLAALTSGVSPRLTAIENALEAIKTAPEVGLVQKGIQAGAFAGVTAMAHAIPGVGAMAPFAGKWASDAIGKTFEHLAVGTAKVSERSKAALDAFLAVGTKNPAATAIAGGRTATEILRGVRFASPASSAAAAGAGPELHQAFAARSAELRSQTMYDATGQTVIRPEARQAIAKRLQPIASVNPLLADKLETLAVRKAEYLSSILPRRPEVGGLQIGPDTWRPSSLVMRSWARSVRAVEDPGSVEEDLARGIMTPEAAHAYRSVYPERFAALQSAIFEAAPQLSKTLPMKRKIALSVFTGVPVVPAMQPNILAVLQASFAMEAGSAGGMAAPQPQPQFTAFGSTPSKEKTAAQRSEEP